MCKQLLRKFWIKRIVYCWSYRLHKLDTPEAFRTETILSSTPNKNENKLWKVHKKGGAHLQYVNYHYAKCEYKRMNTVGVTDYTNQHP